MTVGELFTFNMLSGRVPSRCCGLPRSSRTSTRRACQWSVSAISSTPCPVPAYSPGAVALPAIRGAIASDHVTFIYRLDGRR